MRERFLNFSTGGGSETRTQISRFLNALLELFDGQSIFPVDELS